MPFGLSEAPMFFQACMETLLLGHSGLSTEPYLDDLTCHGTCEEKVWHDTLRTFEILQQEGIMVNLRKCKFLCSRIELLGFVLYDNLHQLGPKSLRGWTDVRLPQTLKEL